MTLQRVDHVEEKALSQLLQYAVLLVLLASDNISLLHAIFFAGTQ